jgi:ribosomal protein S18 acetylase RimI-like enzyme
MADAAPFSIREATLEDLESLETIFPRSFHPVNPYLKATLPATSKVTKWWRQMFSHCIRQEDYRVLLATAKSAKAGRTAKDDEDVAGILLLHHIIPGTTSESCWTLYAATVDHDTAKYTDMVRANGQLKRQTGYDDETRREPYFEVELFGADHDWKGMGIGTALLGRACGIADEAGLETFVEANWTAVAFYERLGFKEKGRMRLPTGEREDEYWECLLVRPVKER